MGRYYRNGRLYSADTFASSGTRTLAGATESALWAGTNAAKPVPAAAGVQLSLVSSSDEDAVARQQVATISIVGTVEDDVAKVTDCTVAGDLQPALPQVTELTLAGDLEPLTTDLHTVSVGGNADEADVARITIDAIDFKRFIRAADNTTALIAAALVDDINLGTFAVYDFQVTGAFDAGDKARIRIDGQYDYEYECAGGEGANTIANALVDAVNAGDGDADFLAYKAVNGGRLLLISKVRGVIATAPVASWPVDPNVSAGWTQSVLVAGVAGCATYTASLDGSDVVLTADAAGTTVVVTSAYAVDALADSTLTTVHTVEGHTADVAAVSDGTTTFQTTVLAGDTANAICIRLASQIDATADYAAPAPGGAVITVTGIDGVPTAWADACTQGSGTGAAIAFTPNDTQASRTADVAGLTLAGTTYTHEVVTGDTLASIALDLAAQVDALADFSCPAPAAAVFTVTGLPGINYAIADGTVQGNGGGVPLTVTPVQQIAAAQGDTVAVADGLGNTFSYEVVAGDATVQDLAVGLRALIDASPLYSAPAPVAGVITVTTVAPGVVTAWADASTDNITVDLTATPVVTVASTTGTGITALRLDYLDDEGTRKSETVVPNGTSAVTTVATDIARILALTATSVGSAGAAVGNITVTQGATQYEYIPAGAALAASADYTIPADRKGYITALHASAGAVATTVRIRSDVNPVTGALVPGGSFVWNTAIVGTDPATVSPVVPLGPFPAGSRVWVTGLSAGGTACQGTVEGYLEPVV